MALDMSRSLPANLEAKLGVGIGLRRPHFNQVFETDREIGWLELLSENFMNFGGRPRDVAERAAARWPVVCHGVGLNLGSTDPMCETYLANLKQLVADVNAPWFSDHLCFSGHGSHAFHDLIPPPRTKESARNIVDRIKRARDFVGKPMAIENVSTYVDNPGWDFSESAFVTEVAEAAECLILLDINNIWVNARNHGLDPQKYLDTVPLDRVVQVHLAGHFDRGDVVIDTHGSAVCDEVWNLYRSFLRKAGRPVATLIEWDNDIPSLDTLLDQADQARTILAEEFHATV